MTEREYRRAKARGERLVQGDDRQPDPRLYDETHGGMPKSCWRAPIRPRLLPGSGLVVRRLAS